MAKGGGKKEGGRQRKTEEEEEEGERREGDWRGNRRNLNTQEDDSKRNSHSTTLSHFFPHPNLIFHLVPWQLSPSLLLPHGRKALKEEVVSPKQNSAGSLSHQRHQSRKIPVSPLFPLSPFPKPPPQPPSVPPFLGVGVANHVSCFS